MEIYVIKNSIQEVQRGSRIQEIAIDVNRKNILDDFDQVMLE